MADLEITKKISIPTAVADLTPEDAYEVGFEEGSRDHNADWQFALTEAFGDDFPYYPTEVVAYIELLHKSLSIASL